MAWTILVPICMSFFAAMLSTPAMSFFFFQAEDGIRDYKVTGVQTCALPISVQPRHRADYGGIGVAGMRPGELRELTRAEVQLLRSQAGKKAEASERPRPVALPARRHGHGPPASGGRTRRGRQRR